MAPEPIMRAALDTLHWATVCCRNWTIREGVSREQINDLMEAIHEVPVMLLEWERHGVADVRLHLACFKHKRWKEPSLVTVFNDRLRRARKECSAPRPKP
jgi:hypothetical protein